MEEVDITDFSIITDGGIIRTSKILLYMESTFFKDLDDDFEMGDEHVSLFTYNTMSVLEGVISDHYIDGSYLHEYYNFAEILAALDFYGMTFYLDNAINQIHKAPYSKNLAKFLISIRSPRAIDFASVVDDDEWNSIIDIVVNSIDLHKQIIPLIKHTNGHSGKCGIHLCESLIKIVQKEARKSSPNDEKIVGIMNGIKHYMLRSYYIKDDILLFMFSRNEVAQWDPVVKYIKQYWKESEPETESTPK
jgi:hypothetical protein